MEVVEYYKEYKGEPVFTMGGRRWEICWGKYPNGKIDIAVYCYDTDMAYDYQDFRESMGIDKPLNSNKLQENMENTNELVHELQSIHKQLIEAEQKFKQETESLYELRDSLSLELIEKFKGQTEGAEKLKVSIDNILVEITQESTKLTASYKNAFDKALTKVNENTRRVLEQLLEESKVASKVKAQLKVGGEKMFEGVDGMLDKVKDWFERAYNKFMGFTAKAEEGIDEIEAMIKNYDEMEGNKYAASNMDDIEAGAIKETNVENMSESEVIKNAANKHVLKGMGGETSKTKPETLPTSGGQVIKNAATKDMAKGKGEKLEGEKSLEEPKKVSGVVKNAATKDVKNGKTEGPASQNIEKQPATGGQSIKNAATKDMAKGSGSKLSTSKPKVVSEDLDTNDGVNKMDEDNETIKNAATKNIKGGKTEVGGKSSNLKNMEEKNEMKDESFMKMRAGAKGKVYESEMEEEGWTEEGWMHENAESRVAAEIAKRLGEMGIGGNVEAMTAGLEAAMANPSPEAEAKAKELLGLPEPPVEQNPIFEDEIPTTMELLSGLAGVITLFGVAYAITEKDKIVAALKKIFGKDKTVKEYTDEHPISTDKAVKDMTVQAPDVKKEEVEEGMDDKLNEAVNRIKQILNY